MKWKIGLAAVALTVATAGFATANEDVINLRKQAMKANGAAAKIIFGMAKGDIPFDAAVAEGAALTIAGTTNGYALLFPAGTESGDTKAGAAIWSDPEGFAAEAAAANEAAMAAAAAASDGLEAFGPTLGALGGSCGSCHETYRN